MNRLIAVVGPSGVGKTVLVKALAKTGKFNTAYEGQHAERPFQALFKNDSRYGLANQIDYHFHCFSRLFHHRGLLTDSELDLCQRLYVFVRNTLPRPELIVRLNADEATV